MAHRDHQGVGAAAEAPLPCGIGVDRIKTLQRGNTSSWVKAQTRSKAIRLTQTVDALLRVHELNRDVTLSLVKVASPISSQVYDHCCCHHGMREVGLSEE